MQEDNLAEKSRKGQSTQDLRKELSFATRRCKPHIRKTVRTKAPKRKWAKTDLGFSEAKSVGEKGKKRT